jgi:UDP-N-acetylglucosamine 2-epimerase
MKKIVSVVGARPQFVKLYPIVTALRETFHHVVLHTGQHYDDAMSKAFFVEFGLPDPDYNLGVGSGTHATQTAAMLTGIEQILEKEQPGAVLVYGDTNSTLAGALAAAKLNIPVAHVEAGLRSGNRTMPEEINRIVTDRLSRLLLCPTETAVKNLEAEGMREGVTLVGDVMFDVLEKFRPAIEQHSSVLERLEVSRGAYYLATVHRASNTDDARCLKEILDAFDRLDAPVLFPIHPRTLKALQSQETTYGWKGNVRYVEPVGHLEMLALITHARRVLTDSGGIQKEAYCLGTPCVTLRRETEWVETLEHGWNRLVANSSAAIVDAAHQPIPTVSRTLKYGDGRAGARIAAELVRFLQ